ncbi:response regulator, partial [Arsukibacterium sp.]|uniref:response regulator n=1 Tax=Arsukibacterium sp. TaxID=1977258 RepID=UPI002FD9F5A2
NRLIADCINGNFVGIPQLLDTAEQRWQAIKGFVYSPYRMDDLITGIFDTQQMRVDFQIFDGANAEPEALMYQSASAIDDTNTHLFDTQHTITKYGNNWTVKMVAQENFAAQFAGQGQWLLPLLGLGISLAIFIMMLLLTRRQEMAQHLANKMFQQYQNAKTHYEQQLTDVFSAASEMALIATDLQGTITLFNSGAERLLGYHAAELVGKTTPALFHLPQEVEARSQQLTEQLGEQISGFNVFVTVPMRQGAESREWHYVNKQGQHIPVALTVTVVRDEQQKITGFLGIAQDITERKRIEQMKNEFISTVSHELRTPLTSVSGALGLVLSGRLGPLSEKAEKILDTAYRNSKRLALLINDLLDIEKIAAGKLHFDMQNHAVSTLLEQAAEDNKAYGAARNVNIELSNETDAWVRVDEQRLKQVLANLLSNAIKFSPDGATDTLAATADENQVTISVLDQGAGIPDDFKKSIFQKFAQANSSDTRQQGGTGLGLAISRQLLEQMHGAIDFESALGKGSRFYIVLPRVKDHLPLSPAPASNSATNHDNAYRILIVEDDADVAHLLQIMLEDAGYQADIRYNGADALQALTTQHYDLLTLDLMLPDTSGLYIIRQLRADAKTANIPVVVVSAKMEQGRLEFNGEAHNIEWLAKPIAHQQLVKLVARQLFEQRYPKILHVEDDIDLHAVISAMVSEQVALDHAPTLVSARKLLTEHTYGAVLLDIGLPDGSGWDLVPFIKAEQPNAAIIVLTGEDVSNDNYPKVEAVLMKTRLSAEQLITVIQQRIGSAAG